MTTYRYQAMLVGILTHGAKFVKAEIPIILSHTYLTIKYGTF